MAYTHSRSFISPLMAEKEATIGTDPTPVGGTDDVLTYGSPIVMKADIARVAFRPHGTSFTRPVSTKTQRVWNVSTNFMFSGSGTRGDPTINGFKGIVALMCSAGAKMAFTSSTSITISPATISQLNTPAAASTGSGASCGPATIYWDANGKFHKSTGTWGNIVMSGSASSGIMCEYRGRGLYTAPTQLGSEFSGWTGGTNRAKACLGIGGTITPSGGSAYTPRFKSFRWDWGNQTALAEDMNSSTGLHSIVVIDRQPTLQVTIGLDSGDGGALDYEDLYANLTATTTHAIAFTVDDNPSGTGTSGTICAYSFPIADLTDIAPADGGGLRDVVLSYELTHTTAESEWSLAIT